MLWLGFSAIGPAPPSRTCANVSLQPRAAGAARPYPRVDPQPLLQPSTSPVRCARSAARFAPKRAPSTSADCPELKRAGRLWKTRSRSGNKEQTYKNRPNGRLLGSGFSAIGPAPPSRTCANVSLPPRCASFIPTPPAVPPHRAPSFAPRSTPQARYPTNPQLNGARGTPTYCGPGVTGSGHVTPAVIQSAIRRRFA
jgi:hypothetical protein